MKDTTVYELWKLLGFAVYTKNKEEIQETILKIIDYYRAVNK